MADTGARAARMMQSLLEGDRWVARWRKLDFLVSMPWQAALGDAPAARVMAAAWALESPDCPGAQFIPGFPLSDTPESGPAVLAYARTADQADRTVR